LKTPSTEMFNILARRSFASNRISNIASGKVCSNINGDCLTN